MIPDRLSVLRLAVSLLTIGVLAAASAPAVHAQKRVQSATQHWTDHFEAQITKVLDSPNREVQEDGLTTLLAVLQDPPPEIDAPSLTPAVLNIVRDDRASDGLRIMALSALSAIDSPRAYEGLLRWVQSDDPGSDRVNRYALLVLRSYQTERGLS